MSDPSPATSTTTTNNTPWSGVMPYLTALYQKTAAAQGGANGEYATTPGYGQYDPSKMLATSPNDIYAGPRVADVNSNQQSAWNSAQPLASMDNANSGNLSSYANSLLSGNYLNTPYSNPGLSGQFVNGVLSGQTGGLPQNVQNYASGMLSGQANGLPSQTSGYLNGVLNGQYLNGSPQLTSAINSAIDPVMQNLTRNTLPGIASAAQGAGAYGGSRQGVVEGQAIGDAAKTAQQLAASLSYQDYSNERANQQSAAGLTSSAYNNQLGANQAAANLLQSGNANQLSLQQALTALGSNNYNTERSLQQGAGNLYNTAGTIGDSSLRDLLLAGTDQGTYNQNQVNAQQALFNESLAAPFRNLTTISQILNGGNYSTGTSTSSQQAAQASPVSQALQTGLAFLPFFL